MQENSQDNGNQELVVLHVVEAFGGGVGSGITSTCELMSRHVRSVIAHGQRDFDPALAARLPDVRLIPWEVQREIGRSDIHALRALRKIVEDVDPDVIHLHSSKAGALGRIATLWSGRSVLYTPHSYSFLRRDVSLSKARFFHFIEYLLSGRGLTIACGLEEYAIARRMSDSVALVANTVRFDIFRREVTAKNPQAPRVMAVGRLVPQKDFEFFRAVARRLPHVRFLWVTGTESPPPAGEANIDMIGKVSPQELAELLRSPAVFLNTSLWEGLSKAVLEACAMGLPLVLRDVPGNRELPYLGADAWLFQTEEQCTRMVSEQLAVVERENWSDKNVRLAKRMFNSDGHEIETIYHSQGFIRRYSD